MKKKKLFSAAGTGIFTILGIVYIMPILIVLMNSFKKKVFINKEPFRLPTEKTWNSIENYLTAIDKYELLSAVGWTVFITLGSVLVILICTSMCAWYITSGGRQDGAQHSLGNHHYLSGIWSGACGLHVLRICQIHSAGDRRGGADRRLYTASDIFPGGAPDHEADLYFGGDPGDYVDLERLPPAVPCTGSE